MVRPPANTVGSISCAAPNAISSPSECQRSMNDLDDLVARPATLGQTRVVLVGARRAARRLVRNLGEKPWSGLAIVGFVEARHHSSLSQRFRCRHLVLHPQADPVPVLGGIDRLEQLLDRAKATDLVVAVSGNRTPHLRRELTQLSNSGVAVHWLFVDSGRLDPAAHGTTRSSGGTEWHLHSPQKPARARLASRRISRGNRLSSWPRIMKRVLDTALATCALIVLSPILVACAVAILVTTGRPIFYSQERVGQGGRLFRIIKFRSMRTDAESVTGPIWASNHDTRCTRIGDWLRHTNIDELPQLLNVIKGDMGLVGPRPERPNFVAEFSRSVPDYDLRHAVPAGMTGWAQVHGWRGRTSLRKRIQYDLDYIERWSLGLDLRIMLMTIQHVFWGKTSWNEPKRKQKTRG
jgi:undecaprenyl-phosphate glucose phosphotransferase